MSEYPQYTELRDLGVDSKGCYSAAKKNGMGLIEGIRMLRVVYDLSLVDAKDVCIQVDHGVTLDEYQKNLFPEVEAAFAAVEEETED